MESKAENNLHVHGDSQEHQSFLSHLLIGALNLFQMYADSNLEDKYQILTTGTPSPVQIVFSHYYQFLQFRHQRQIESAILQIIDYDLWKQHLIQRFGVDFNFVKPSNFQHEYLPLYIDNKLHAFASHGIVRSYHIHNWSKISPFILPQYDSLESIIDSRNLDNILLGILEWQSTEEPTSSLGNNSVMTSMLPETIERKDKNSKHNSNICSYPSQMKAISIYNEGTKVTAST